VQQSHLSQRRNKLRVVGARIGYGAAWGALPLVGAAAAGAAGNTTLTLLLCLLTFCASVLAPLAPFLPALHRLPLVGSPRIDVVFRLNGRRDMTLTVPKGEEHTCILDVEITNRERWTAIKDAWLNLLVPSGIKVVRCTQRGEPEDGGKWEDFHSHQLGTYSRADYWHDLGWSFPPRLTRRIRIKLRLGHAGETLEFPILLKLAGPSLYRMVEASTTLIVREGEPTVGDQMGKVITHGEQTLGELKGFMLHMDRRAETQALQDFVAAASKVLIQGVGDNPLPQTPQDIDATGTEDKIKMHLTALYVVRDELGRAADPA
jgi:hypothetical protein